jgi:hypothetical protein
MNLIFARRDGQKAWMQGSCLKMHLKWISGNEDDYALHYRKNRMLHFNYFFYLSARLVGECVRLKHVNEQENTANHFMRVITVCSLFTQKFTLAGTMCPIWWLVSYLYIFTFYKKNYFQNSPSDTLNMSLSAAIIFKIGLQCVWIRE